MTKILILEDEPRACRQLLKVLDSCGFQYELIHTIDSVRDAIDWFSNNPSPELIFMDIQLADGLCFEIFLSVTIDSSIIFTTAFDQYAIKAFKFNSVDYLLKPIKQDEMKVSLDKYQRNLFKNQLNETTISTITKMLNIEKTESRKGVLVKVGSGFKQVKMEEILFLYSSESITFLRTKSKRYMLDETLDQFYNTIDPSMFFRINRGQIVHKSAILKFESYFNHRLKLKLEEAGDMEFVVSRQRSSDFKKWMNY